VGDTTVVAIFIVLAVVGAAILVLNPMDETKFRIRLVYTGSARPISFAAGAVGQKVCYCSARGVVTATFIPRVGPFAVAKYRLMAKESNDWACWSGATVLIKKTNLASQFRDSVM
jgi:hypothetical protein